MADGRLTLTATQNLLGCDTVKAAQQLQPVPARYDAHSPSLLLYCRRSCCRLVSLFRAKPLASLSDRSTLQAVKYHSLPPPPPPPPPPRYPASDISTVKMATLQLPAGLTISCSVLFIPASALMLGMRFYTRSKQKAGWGIDDWLMIPAFVSQPCPKRV